MSDLGPGEGVNLSPLTGSGDLVSHFGGSGAAMCNKKGFGRPKLSDGRKNVLFMVRVFFVVVSWTALQRKLHGPD